MKAMCPSCGEVKNVPWPKPGERRPSCQSCGVGLVRPPAKPREDGGRPARKQSLRRRQPERIWDDARAKVADERQCRFCGTRLNAEHLQACHIVGRERDAFDPVTREPRDQPWHVHPDRIAPGCAGCHDAFDRGDLDLIGKLTLEEELQAVRDSWPPVRGSGIEIARRRLAPLAYRESGAVG